MSIAIFDLDNTLLAGDSDYLWGEYMIKNRLVEPTWFKTQNDKFYQDYKNGKLDILAWLELQATSLSKIATDKLFESRADFISTVIKPIILTKALTEIDKHVRAGNILVIITATNDFITRPIADILGIEHLIAAEFEFKNNKYTGKIIGAPSYQEGKVTRFKSWLKANDLQFQDCYFYTDSYNDMPLLQMVDKPIAVDPDTKLKSYAENQGWKIISFR